MFLFDQTCIDIWLYVDTCNFSECCDLPLDISSFYAREVQLVTKYAGFTYWNISMMCTTIVWFELKAWHGTLFFCWITQFKRSCNNMICQMVCSLWISSESLTVANSQSELLVIVWKSLTTCGCTRTLSNWVVASGVFLESCRCLSNWGEWSPSESANEFGRVVVASTWFELRLWLILCTLVAQFCWSGKTENGSTTWTLSTGVSVGVKPDLFYWHIVQPSFSQD